MISSEERKQIVAYLYRLIKESPLFTTYTDDRIKEAAVKAEQKAYSTSSSKEEYLKAMNNKIDRIKKSKAGDTQNTQTINKSTPLNTNRQGEEDVYNKRSQEESHYKTNNQNPQQVPKNTNETGALFATQTIGRTQPVFTGLNPQDTQFNNVDDLHAKGYKKVNEHKLNNLRKEDYVNFNVRTEPLTTGYSDNNFFVPNNGAKQQSFNGDKTLYNSKFNGSIGFDDKHRKALERAEKLSGFLQGGINTNNTAFYEGYSPDQPIGKGLFVSNRISREPGKPQPTVSPSGRPANYDSFVYVNDLNNSNETRFNEAKSFNNGIYDPRKYELNNFDNHNLHAYNRVGLSPSTAYITERGFHSNQKLFDQGNYHESNLIQGHHHKTMQDVRGVPLKYRQRGDNGFDSFKSVNSNLEGFSPYANSDYRFIAQQDTYKRDLGQSGSGMYINGLSQRYPRTSPIGMAPIKKTDRSFSNENQAAMHFNSHDKGFSPTLGREMKPHSRNSPIEHRGYNTPAAHGFNGNAHNIPMQLGSKKRLRNSDSVLNGNLRLEKNVCHRDGQRQAKQNEFDEDQANELFNSFGSLFDQSNSSQTKQSKNSQGDIFYENSSIGDGEFHNKPRKERLDLTVPLHANLPRKPVYPGQRSPKQSPKSPARTTTALFEDERESKKKIKNEYKSPEGQSTPELDKRPRNKPTTTQSNIPLDLQEFMNKNNLKIIETPEQNVALLGESLKRCEEMLDKASKMYIEHKNEFTNSNLHQSYCRTTELLSKQKEAISLKVYFLTWRCVDDLLDTLKSVYIDMKAELENVKNKTVKFPEAINNACVAFNNAKKRDDDFVLDLREK